MFYPLFVPERLNGLSTTSGCSSVGAKPIWFAHPSALLADGSFQPLRTLLNIGRSA